MTGYAGLVREQASLPKLSPSTVPAQMLHEAQCSYQDLPDARSSDIKSGRNGIFTIIPR